MEGDGAEWDFRTDGHQKRTRGSAQEGNVTPEPDVLSIWTHSIDISTHHSTFKISGWSTPTVAYADEYRCGIAPYVEVFGGRLTVGTHLSGENRTGLKQNVPHSRMPEVSPEKDNSPCHQCERRIPSRLGGD